MAKNNQKCVRLSDEVLEVVEKQKGQGFNEKFENLVLEFRDTIPVREQYIKDYDKKIKDNLKLIEDIEKRISQLQSIEFDLEQIKKLAIRTNDTATSLQDVSQVSIQDLAAASKSDIQKKKRVEKVG